MSYCGLDLVRSLGPAKTSVQVVMVTATGRTEMTVREGLISHVVGCNLEELLERLTEGSPVITINPVAHPEESSAGQKISVLSLEIARQHDPKKKVSEPTPPVPQALGPTISTRIKPIVPDNMKKARPILFRPGEPPSITIGRDDDCHVKTEDHRASRRHCRVTIQKDNFFVQDLDSTNGTYLNGERIHAVKARAGDVLMIGEDRFILMSQNGV